MAQFWRQCSVTSQIANYRLYDYVGPNRDDAVFEAVVSMTGGEWCFTAWRFHQPTGVRTCVGGNRAPHWELEDAIKSLKEFDPYVH